jgi:hypothetical protein
MIASFCVAAADVVQEDGFTTTVTSPLGTSTSFICAPLTSSVSSRAILSLLEDNAEPHG